MNLGEQVLSSGVLLCRLVNAVSPGIVRSYKDTSRPFECMANIGHFTQVCLERELVRGCPRVLLSSSRPAPLAGVQAVGRHPHLRAVRPLSSQIHFTFHAEACPATICCSLSLGLVQA